MECQPVRTPVSTTTAQKLSLFIPYTTRKLTARALGAALALTRGLEAEATVVAVQVVPFPCPLDQPPVDPAHMQRELGELAGNAGMLVRARVILARDRVDGFRCALRPGSLILVAAKRRLWRTAEEKLARSLARTGHSVAVLAA